MSKRCAKCDKLVYPLEELKCLDKVWHKGCFRCWECNMALNMKTYKGFDKKPYCNAHYPTTRFTPVAETPEMARLAQNTKMQSQIQYHQKFEKSKGRLTSVTDDPEMLRIMQNSRNISSVKYHEEFEKNIKGTKIQVPDDPETQRIKATTAVISQVEYKKLRERAQEMEEQRDKIPQEYGENQAYDTQERPTGRYDPSRVGGVSMTPNEAVPSPLSTKNQGHSIIYNSKGKVEHGQPRRVGSIHDYDPLNEQHGSLTSGYKPSSAMSQSAQWEETTPAPQTQNHAPPQAHVPLPTPNTPDIEPPTQEPAPPAELSESPPAEEERRPDPNPDQHYPPPQHNMAPQPMTQQVAAPAPQMTAPSQPVAPAQPPPAQPEPVVPAAPAGSANVLSGPVYQAMYDYEAQDDDEIGFVEGDIIINCQAIDEGWMFGTCRRTGQRGMLPANYVERIQ